MLGARELTPDATGSPPEPSLPPARATDPSARAAGPDLIAYLAMAPVAQRSAGIAALQSGTGNHQVARLILARAPDDAAVERRVQEIRQELSRLSHMENDYARELNRLNHIGSDLIEHSGGEAGRKGRPSIGNAPRTPDPRVAPIGRTADTLRELAEKQNNAQARELVNQIEHIQRQQEDIPRLRSDLNRELTAINPRAQAGNLRPRNAPPPPGPPGGGGGGGGGGSSAPPAQPPPGEVAAAAKQVSRFRTITGNVLRSVGRITKTVAGPILAMLQFVDAIELIQATESGVTGEGFVFRGQFAQAHKLSQDVDAVVKSYKDGGYHQQLDELVRTAKQNDEKYSQYALTPPEYWGSEELSAFCLSAIDTVNEHYDSCAKLLESMRRAEHEVSVRYDSCVKILSDPVMMGMLSYPTSAPAARVLMARDDLDKIDRLLGPATGGLAAHVKTVEQDRQALYDNILQQGWAI